MSLTQGSPLPNITTTQAQTTTAPSWYTDYLSGLASKTAQAASGAEFVGAQPLQTGAFDMAAGTIGDYRPTLSAATNMVTGAGTTRAPSVVSQYMNPYTQNVVEQIGALGRRNIEQNLQPLATAGGIGAGQFGSRRGLEVTGNVIRDALQDIGARQAGALSQGYQNAILAAQTDLQRQLGAGTEVGNIAEQEQKQRLADINMLSTLGEQQQKIKQAEQLFPLETLGKAAQNLRGYSIPTNVASTYTGPIPGAYAASPLQQIAGLGAIVGGISATPFGKSAGDFLTEALKKFGGASGVTGYTGTIDDALNAAKYPGATYEDKMQNMLEDIYGTSYMPNINDLYGNIAFGNFTPPPVTNFSDLDGGIQYDDEWYFG